MTNTLLEYALFLAQAITIVVAVLFILGGIISMFSKGKSDSKDQVEIKNLNDKFEGFAQIINKETLPKDEFKKLTKAEKVKKKQTKKEKKSEPSKTAKARLFVLNFNGDIKASAVESLREEVTAVLTVAQPNDQILLRLESSGGMVHSYGLAASQLQRIKQKSIQLTVSVDKVAASGGYMMACVADQIVAAPFAIIGSIGVVAQVPNFNRFLKEHHVDFEQFTAGKYKRTVTMFGENTEEGRKKLKQELEDTHTLFQDFILDSRKNLNMDQIATGEHWYGKKALDLNLVDQLMTGDDLLLSQCENFEIYEVSYSIKKSIKERIPFVTANAIKSIFERLFPRQTLF